MIRMTFCFLRTFRLSDIQKDAFVHADVDGIDPNAVGVVKDLKDGKLLVHIDPGPHFF